MRYRLRDASSWFEWDGETVALVVARRDRTAPDGRWLFVRCEGSNIREAEAAYSRYCVESAEVTAQQTRRRAAWGVL